ncbi:Mediator of RNA polymerase II transcription subunit 19 [Wickerhamomyces ciferrii]|uniref:Mediator of RNA polymerase II transcription subunit 19 n=1 Tax=Wickerhamomyces ciferrii (strain ATCC 14091 / BCRC 22168 / CBS 111 / JCM 3599 / NBRC 0793 / NRRL Y-1031 F-60-10) TaxID=1206466 RepID=K0KMS0_WICCF|nr:Mediator of RNA polymerase II transcription subunit 19 [Wickerhamomyces ciferrii]CCH46575.1 Mediator of RNA polymerase II transcription subunit 19 [Wickerhamomyces ciferrii]
MSDVNTSNPYYYYIDPTVHYTKSRPHPNDNLIDLYNLSNIANSVARVNETGSKGVKLRKSYKAHINDLPGKHNNIPKDRTISPIVYAPEREGAPININKFDNQILKNYLNFQKTNDDGIHGFDPANLAMGEFSSQGTKRKQKKSNDEDLKRRRVDY